MTRVLLQCLSDGSFSIHNSLKRKDSSTSSDNGANVCGTDSSIDEADDSWDMSLNEQMNPNQASRLMHHQSSSSMKFHHNDNNSNNADTGLTQKKSKKRRRTFVSNQAAVTREYHHTSETFGNNSSTASTGWPLSARLQMQQQKQSPQMTFRVPPRITPPPPNFFSDSSTPNSATDSPLYDPMCDDDDNSSTSSFTSFDHSVMLQWFQKYADFNNDSLISGKNWERFRRDCGFHTMMDTKFFFFVFSLECSSKDYITRGEWIRGMYALKCDCPEKLLSRLEEAMNFAHQCWRSDDLKELFTFVFKYLRDSNKCRTIDTKLGARALSCLIQNRFSHSFVEFLLKSDCKRLNLDQFRIFVDFSRTYENDLYMTSYDPNDAFPCLYDEYVEYFRTVELHLPPLEQKSQYIRIQGMCEC